VETITNKVKHWELLVKIVAAVWSMTQKKKKKGEVRRRAKVEIRLLNQFDFPVKRLGETDVPHPSQQIHPGCMGSRMEDDR
jgi:hypothetical protein